jgi:hypothetical protein
MLKFQVSWDVMLYGCENYSQRLKGLYCLNTQYYAGRGPVDEGTKAF